MKKLIEITQKFFYIVFILSVGYWISLQIRDSFRYKWSYAINSDGSIYPKEECRETLAALIYRLDLKPENGRDNIFKVTGVSEPYTIYAFKTWEDCDRALTNMVLRRKTN